MGLGSTGQSMMAKRSQYFARCTGILRHSQPSIFSRHALVVCGMASNFDIMLNGNQNHGLLLLVRNALWVPNVSPAVRKVARNRTRLFIKHLEVWMCHDDYTQLCLQYMIQISQRSHILLHGSHSVLTLQSPIFFFVELRLQKRIRLNSWKHVQEIKFFLFGKLKCWCDSFGSGRLLSADSVTVE